MSPAKTRRPDYVAIMGGTRNGAQKVHPGCDIHKAIAEKALDELTVGPAYFQKDYVMQTAVPGIDMSHFRDSIAWEYICRYIKETVDGDLIPLAGSFFEAIKKSELQKMGLPDCYASKSLYEAMNKAQEIAEATGDYTHSRKLAGRAIAQGHNKTTAGYAAVTACNSGLVLKRLGDKAARARGTMKAYDDLSGEAGVKGLPVDEVARIQAR